MVTTLPWGIPLTSVSVLLPVINETFSLSKTVDILEAENGDVIKEYIIIVSPKKTIQASIDICNRLKERLPKKIVVLPQKRPFLGGACMDAFDVATGSHLIMMASDLETDPHQVKEMIALARRNPGQIVLNSRWIAKGKFVGYDRTKLVMNYFFQKFFAVLFQFACTDFTYAFRIYPTALVQAIQWNEFKHPFLLESLLKPLRLGVKTIEIPAIWRPRKEGESQNTFLGNFPYLAVGVRIRLMSRASILKESK
jgi:glycosyltransferase involved in cell wall biosynthesis